MAGSHIWNLRSRSKARLRTSLQRSPWLLSSISPCFILLFPRDHNLRLFSLHPQAECKHIMVDSLPDCSPLYFQCLAHCSVPLITEWGNEWITDNITESYYKIFNRDSSSLRMCPVSRSEPSQGNHFSTGLLENSFKLYFKPLIWNIVLLLWYMVWPSYLMVSDHVALSYPQFLCITWLDTHHFVTALDMWHMKVILQPPQSSLPLHTHRGPTVYRAGLSISLFLTSIFLLYSNFIRSFLLTL